MNLRIAHFANILLFALVMGVFWGTWFSLSRSIAAITPQAFLEIGHLMIRNLGGPMSVLLPAALASSLVVVILLFRRRRIAAFSLAMAGLLLMVAALAVTLAVNVPIDDQINQWTVTTLPDNWTVIRDRWEFFHGIRTFASVGALGFAVASILRWTPSSHRIATN
jgi:uncharacterized membrane protein